MIVEGVISVWSSVPPPPIITSAPPPAPPPLPQLHPHPPPHYNWALIQSRVIKNFHTGSADGHSTEFPSYMLNHCNVLAQRQSMHWHYQNTKNIWWWIFYHPFHFLPSFSLESILQEIFSHHYDDDDKDGSRLLLGITHIITMVMRRRRTVITMMTMIMRRRMTMMTWVRRWVKGVAKVVTCPALIAQGCLQPTRLYNAARENLFASSS